MSPVNYPIEIKKIPFNRKPGKIIYTVSNSELRHEHETAELLARFGHEVKFIRPINRQGIKTADCLFKHDIWEIKAPHKNKRDTFIRDIREATSQSKNIIIFVGNSTRTIRQVAIDIINFMRERRTKKIQKVLILDKENYCFFTRDDVL